MNGKTEGEDEEKEGKEEELKQGKKKNEKTVLVSIDALHFYIQLFPHRTHAANTPPTRQHRSDDDGDDVETTMTLSFGPLLAIRSHAAAPWRPRVWWRPNLIRATCNHTSPPFRQ